MNHITSPRLSMKGVQKRFGATVALKRVDLEILPGETHALIGENGAGKSTLMKTLSGAIQPDAGEMFLEGQPFTPESPSHARESGIAMIYQELNLAPGLSVAENITLGVEPSKWGWVKVGERDRMAREALETLHHGDLPLNTPVGALSIAEQQIVEIARALLTSPKALIMDEPTSSLTQVDVQNLFRVIERLKANGVSVIYISHFLEECQQVADRFTVLRDGETIATGLMDETPLDQIIHWMVGREMKDIYPEKKSQPGEVAVKVRGLRGKRKPSSVDLDLKKGEILGLAGLIGSGRTETARALFGLDTIEAGVVELSGLDKTHRTPGQRLGEGMGLLSENRKEEGLLLNLSLADNLTLTHLKPFTRWGWVSSKKQNEATEGWIKKLQVKAAGVGQAIGELSGGNQQKIAIGRLLHHDASILILDEPTRGIDVGSKAQIYHLIHDLAESGASILFISSYLPELLGVCDRIAVMRKGEIGDVRPVGNWTEHELIQVALGQETAAQS